MRHSLNCFRCGKGISHDVATDAGRTAFTADTAIVPGKLGSFRHVGCPSLTGTIADDTRNGARAHNRATFETIGFTCGEDRTWKAAGAKPVKAPAVVVAGPIVPSKLARIAGETAAAYVARISPADVVESLTDAGPAAIDAYAAKLTARNGTIEPAAPKPVRRAPPAVVVTPPAAVVTPPAVLIAGTTITIPRAALLTIIRAAYTPDELGSMALDGIRPDVCMTIGDRGMYRVIAG